MENHLGRNKDLLRRRLGVMSGYNRSVLSRGSLSQLIDSRGWSGMGALWPGWEQSSQYFCIYLLTISVSQ